MQLLSYSLLGTPFDIQSESLTLSSEINRLLQPFAQSGVVDPANVFSVGGDGEDLDLYRNSRRLLTGAGVGVVVLRIIAEINRSAVEAVPHFSVHASVVANDQRVLVTVAESGGGKSTLAAALLRQGFRYGSDEVLCMDPEGRVIPYPKPITLNRWSWRNLGLRPGEFYRNEAPFLATELGADFMETGRSPTDLLIPVLTKGEPVLMELEASTTIVTLLRNSFNHFKDGARAYRLATALGRSMKVWQVGVADPLDTARVILGHFS